MTIYRGLYLQLHASALRKYGNCIGLWKVSRFTIKVLDDDELHIRLHIF